MECRAHDRAFEGDLVFRIAQRAYRWAPNKSRQCQAATMGINKHGVRNGNRPTPRESHPSLDRETKDSWQLRADAAL